MKDVLLSNVLSPLETLFAAAQTGLGRRRFMQTAAVFSAALALRPANVFAEPAEAGEWRDLVTGFVDRICESDYRQAESINYVIKQSVVEAAPRAVTFHQYYAAPLIFTTTVDLQIVICHNGFKVLRFPYYDIQHPVREVNDLNAYEIRRVTNAKEISLLGCVVAPTSSRTNALESNADHADYRRTMGLYGLNPNEFTPEYKRVFTGRGRSRMGYQVAQKNVVGSNGGTRRDILLSDQDW